MSDPSALASAPYLVVRVAGQLCALPLSRVIEVLRPPESLAAVPEPSGLLGMVTLRGEVTAAFDLAQRLGFAPGDTEPAAPRLVSLRMESRPAAFRIDEVIGVRDLPPASLTRIDLPDGGERVLGRFDEQWVQLVESAGLVPAEVLP